MKNLSPKRPLLKELRNDTWFSVRRILKSEKEWDERNNGKRKSWQGRGGRRKPPLCGRGRGHGLPSHSGKLPYRTWFKKMHPQDSVPSLLGMCSREIPTRDRGDMCQATRAGAMLVGVGSVVVGRSKCGGWHYAHQTHQQQYRQTLKWECQGGKERSLQHSNIYVNEKQHIKHCVWEHT